MAKYIFVGDTTSKNPNNPPFIVCKKRDGSDSVRLELGVPTDVPKWFHEWAAGKSYYQLVDEVPSYKEELHMRLSYGSSNSEGSQHLPPIVYDGKTFVEGMTEAKTDFAPLIDTKKPRGRPRKVA